MKSRTSLLLIAVVCALPLVLGTAAYVLRWTPGSSANYGELLAPRPLSVPPFDALRGKWLLVMFDAASCSEACERKLYFMRQVRKAQGENQSRVERLWLVTDQGKPPLPLLAAIEGTRVLPVSEPVQRAFPGNPLAHIYLVDPLGNLMLRFPENPDPSRMLKDLQRLLRLSQIG